MVLESGKSETKALADSVWLRPISWFIDVCVLAVSSQQKA